ncbi:MAG TPA: LemA family protein, partial [Dongiaceae bacterium]
MLLSLFVALPLAGCGVNNIPSYSEQAKATWAQVLNQYQRRTDLVPNLVATVKGAADFESKTLQAVVEARAKVGQMQLPDLGAGFDHGLQGLALEIGGTLHRGHQIGH